VRCVSVANVSKVERKSPAQSSGWKATAAKHSASVQRWVYADFCNKIGPERTPAITTTKSAFGTKTPKGRHRRDGERDYAGTGQTGNWDNLTDVQRIIACKAEWTLFADSIRASSLN
jgi:hypothetical protein